MKELLLITSLALSLFGFSDANAGNPAVIYGAGGRALIIPANGLEFNGGETLDDTDVAQLKNILLPFTAVLSDGAIATYFSVGVDQVSATNLDVTKRFEVISTTEASHSCPTMTTIQRDLLTPVAGDCIFNSTSLTREFWTGVVWMLTSPNGLPTLAKGSLLTSDGAINGELTACPDGERLEWDAAETSGIKCVARVRPSYVETAGASFNEASAIYTTYYTFPTVTLEAGLYEIGLHAVASQVTYIRVKDFTSPSGTVIGGVALYRDGGQKYSFQFGSVNLIAGQTAVASTHSCSSVKFLERITTTASNSYSLRFAVTSGDFIEVSNCKAYYRKLE
jgi:hypothetical protein